MKPHFLSVLFFFFCFFNSEALPGEMPPEQVGDYTSLDYNPRHQFWFCLLCMLKKMSNVFQNAYRRFKCPRSMTHEHACKPISAVHNKGDLPGLCSCRSCRCFSDRPLLESPNCFLEKPAFNLCGFLGFPSTSPDGNDLDHPGT